MFRDLNEKIDIMTKQMENITRETNYFKKK